MEAIAKMSEGRKADTIYMGGGTPSTLNTDQLDRLLTCIDRHFVREGLLEFTVEAGRPDSITNCLLYTSFYNPYRWSEAGTGRVAF